MHIKLFGCHASNR